MRTEQHSGWHPDYPPALWGRWARPLYVGLVTSWKDDGSPIELYAKGYSRQPVVDDGSRQLSGTMRVEVPEGAFVIDGFVLFEDYERKVLWSTLDRRQIPVYGGDTLTVKWSVSLPVL